MIRYIIRGNQNEKQEKKNILCFSLFVYGFIKPKDTSARPDGPTSDLEVSILRRKFSNSGVVNSRSLPNGMSTNSTSSAAGAGAGAGAGASDLASICVGARVVTSFWASDGVAGGGKCFTSGFSSVCPLLFSSLASWHREHLRQKHCTQYELPQQAFSSIL